MTEAKGVVLVVDPVGSARRYPIEIISAGYSPVVLLSRTSFPGQVGRLHSTDGYEKVMLASTFMDALAVLENLEICAVIPGSDSGLEMSDFLSEYYRLPGNAVDTCRFRVNKASMRNQLISLRVSTIAAYPISLDSLASGMPIPIPFPLVVKPSYGTGSKNVAVCKDTGDLYKSLARIESTDSSYLDKERLAHVEEFIDGAEYFIVTLNSGPSSARQMLCVGSYEKVKNFAETYVYRTIKSVSTSCAIAVKAFAHASEVNAAIGMDVGINDIEFKVGEKGLHIIEQNGRLPGANVPALIELCTGHNCYRLNLDVYLGRGRAVGGPLSYIKHFSICCMIAEERGTLASVKGLSFVMKLQSYHSHSLLVQPGDEVNLTEDFLSAWGFVYLVHPDPQVLAQESELVHKYLVLCMS